MRIPPKAASKVAEASEPAFGAAEPEPPEDESMEYSPDAIPGGYPLDSEAEEIERYARGRAGESDIETDAEPIAPDAEIEIIQDDDYQFYHDRFDIPECEEIASEGMKIDSISCLPIFDIRKRFIKDLLQKGMISKKDIRNRFKLTIII